MKRQHPFISLLGASFTMVLLVGLGLSIWRSGGKAFSPGSLSEKMFPGVTLNGFTSHAQFEARCSLCHAPLAAAQVTLCEDCHVSVEEEISGRQGLHGKINNANQCAACHSEHRGRNFDPGLGGMKSFDHSATSFSLVWHQVNYDATPIDCLACHTVQGGFATPDGQCAVCHARHDAAYMLKHIQEFGQDCSGCHDGHDRMVHFDHQATRFPLQGRHAELNCADCHGQKAQPAAKLTALTFRSTPLECAGCHIEPSSHEGVFDRNCAACHNSIAWQPAILQEKPFEHTSDASFSLALHAIDYSGQPITCKSCHPDSVQQTDLQTCVACHAGENGQPDAGRAGFMSKHLAQYGPACLDCHDGVDRMHNFNHASVFPLEGAHSKIDCVACHVDKAFKGTPKECLRCHSEPKIHAGVFGLQCQDCHSVQAWTPAKLQRHAFPLDHGGRGEVACTTCHANTYVEYTCYGCHDHQPGPIRNKHIEENVSLVDLPNCDRCHPTGLEDEPHN